MTKNLLPNYLAGPSWINLHEGAVTLVAMPLYHVTGCAWLLLGIIAGATNIVLRVFDPVKVLQSVPEHKVSHIILVPAAILFVLQMGAQLKPDLSTLKCVLYGASPIPEELLRRAMQFFKCDFVQLYGLTETSGGVTLLSTSQHRQCLEGVHKQRLKSAGQAIFGTDVKVVDAKGNDCLPGEMGEIIIHYKWLTRDEGLLEQS
jgi:acyl-CoA synthetase (AMP-forming)/AMP-acid ligase II